MNKCKYYHQKLHKINKESLYSYELSEHGKVIHQVELEDIQISNKSDPLTRHFILKIMFEVLNTTEFIIIYLLYFKSERQYNIAKKLRISKMYVSIYKAAAIRKLRQSKKMKALIESTIGVKRNNFWSVFTYNHVKPKLEDMRTLVKIET